MAKQAAVLLHVALDGSGSVERDRVVAYGFVAGLAPNWEAFHSAWTALLDKHSLGYIRMAEAMSFRGAFEQKALEWGDHREETRDAALLEAVTIIREHLIPGGAVLDLEGLPNEKEFRYRKKMLFQYVVHKLLQNTPPDRVLAFLCDDEQDSAPEFYRQLSNLKLRDHDVRKRVGGICFFKDEQMSQIQAADLVAYALRDERKRRLETPDGPAFGLANSLFAGSTTETDQIEFRIQGARIKEA